MDFQALSTNSEIMPGENEVGRNPDTSFDHKVDEASRPGEIQKARILLVEDHPFARRAIEDLVNQQTDLSCCGTVDSAAHTPSAVAEFSPDLLLLDLRLRDGESSAMINGLKSVFPRLPIVVLAQGNDVLQAERALRAGAKGYVLKHGAVNELITAVRSVLAGKLYVSDALMGGLLKRVIASL